MPQQQFPRTFDYQEDPLFTLSAYLNPAQDSLKVTLKVLTPTFPKYYSQIFITSILNEQQRVFFESVEEVYEALEQMNNVDVHHQEGIITVGFTFMANKKEKSKKVKFVLERCVEAELDEIRKIIEKESSNQMSKADFQERVEKLWRREEENQKIFMKFKEEVELRLEEISERMSIQNTRISMMSQDISDVWEHLGKLTKLLCPMLSKVSIREEFIDSFLLQDRKIVYVGESGVWSQIIFKEIIGLHKKYEFTCKILNSKKNNILVGITSPKNVFSRGSLKKERAIVALAANGILYEQITSTHSDSSSDKQKLETSRNSQPMKAMQIIKMTIDPQKRRVSWSCAGKQLSQSRLGQFKNEQMVAFIQFYDTGDTIQVL